MIAELEAELAPLVGLPLWGAACAGGMEMLQLGPRQPAQRGPAREVGTYALHLQCPWRIRGAAGIVVGSADSSETVAAWVASHACVVEHVTADAAGGFVLGLGDGFALEVFPDGATAGEHWRLLHPSGHVVVSGAGVEIVC